MYKVKEYQTESFTLLSPISTVHRAALEKTSAFSKKANYVSFIYTLAFREILEILYSFLDHNLLSVFVS